MDTLRTAIEDYQEILLCKRRLALVEKELLEQKINLQHLHQVVEKEHQDVLLLEEKSLRQLFSVLLVNKEAQLEKEKQEYLLAALKHNEAHKLVELLNYEKKVLKSKIKSEAEITQKFEEALNDFQIPKPSQSTKELFVLKSINNEINSIILLKAEAQEALAVVRELMESFKSILKDLEAATLYENWGQFYKEKQLAKVRKKKYIDQAQSKIYIVRKQLIFLRSELLDVEEFKGVFEEAKVLIDEFNLGYYNELITDWIKVLKLEATIEHTLTTHKTISKISRMLKKLIKNSDQEYQILLIKRATLIEKISS